MSIYFVKIRSEKEKKKKTNKPKVKKQGFRNNQISSPVETSEGLDVLNLLIINFPKRHCSEYFFLSKLPFNFIFLPAYLQTINKSATNANTGHHEWFSLVSLFS